MIAVRRSGRCMLRVYNTSPARISVLRNRANPGDGAARSGIGFVCAKTPSWRRNPVYIQLYKIGGLNHRVETRLVLSGFYETEPIAGGDAAPAVACSEKTLPQHELRLENRESAWALVVAERAGRGVRRSPGGLPHRLSSGIPTMPLFHPHGWPAKRPGIGFVCAKTPLWRRNHFVFSCIRSVG